MINTESIANKTAKAALEAWQSGDLKTWLAFFTKDATLYDDGNRRDFMVFSKEAIGHERFVGIDKTDNDGLHIYGRFHSEQWGDFKTYFKFHINTEGKFFRLDIGQAHY